jgi:hypothetical protein
VYVPKLPNYYNYYYYYYYYYCYYYYYYYYCYYYYNYYYYYYFRDVARTCTWAGTWEFSVILVDQSRFVRSEHAVPPSCALP